MENGKKKEDTEFHRIVVWSKLAEICSQYLKKGRKAYFHGRLATRQWTAQDGTQKSTTEIIADDMIILSSERDGSVRSEVTPAQKIESSVTDDASLVAESALPDAKTAGKNETGKEEPPVSPEDIPF